MKEIHLLYLVFSSIMACSDADARCPAESKSTENRLENRVALAFIRVLSMKIT